MESKDLVNDVMKQLEIDNGTYNEETGYFNKQNNQFGSLIGLQKQLLYIIDNNPQLKNLMENEKNRAKIEQILQLEDVLQQLLRDSNQTAVVLVDLLTEVSQDGQSLEQNISPIKPAIKPSSIVASSNIFAPPSNEVTNSNLFQLETEKEPVEQQVKTSFSWLELLSGPIIAMVCFFLVTNTPLLYYIGRIPYLGEYLINIKLLTELLMVGVLFLALSIAFEFLH